MDLFLIGALSSTMAARDTSGPDEGFAEEADVQEDEAMDVANSIGEEGKYSVLCSAQVGS